MRSPRAFALPDVCRARRTASLPIRAITYDCDSIMISCARHTTFGPKQAAQRRLAARNFDTSPPPKIEPLVCSFPRALANGRPNSPFLDRYRPDQVG
jgi:hypothetical protein